MLFIEASNVTGWLAANFADDDYGAFQRYLAEHPDIGAVMSGCGGLRKIRMGDPRRQQGKRGGARVVYLHVPEAERIYFVMVYTKDQKETIGPAEKKILRRVAEQIRVDAIKATAASMKGPRQ